MATFDTSMYGAIKPIELPNPLAQYAQVAQIQQAQNQNRLADLAFADKERERQGENALSQLIAQNADPQAVFTGLAAQGFGKQALSYQDVIAKRAKAQADLQKVQQEAAAAATKFHRERLADVTDPASARNWLASQYADPAIKDIIARGGSLDEAVARIPQDPKGFADWLERQAVGMDKFLEARRPKVDKVDDGANIMVRDLNPQSPTFNQTFSTTKKQVTPGEQLQADTTRRGQNMVDARANEANRLKREELSQNAGTNQPVLGVPIPTVTPWAGQSNPKDANKVKAAEVQRGNKEVEKDSDAARKAAEAARDAERFLQLNKTVNTGGMVDKVGVGRWAQSMGSDYAEMEALTARLAPQNRVEGSGATSDFDAKQFERATVGVDKPRQANENIGKALIARAKQLNDYAEFRQTYLEQNGTLQGADRYWKQYAEKNPIFKPDAKNFELNPSRQDWRTFFQKSTKAATPQPASASKVIDFNQLP